VEEIVEAGELAKLGEDLDEGISEGKAGSGMAPP
jgi:hypothetical protein